MSDETHPAYEMAIEQLEEILGQEGAGVDLHAEGVTALPNGQVVSTVSATKGELHTVATICHSNPAIATLAAKTIALSEINHKPTTPLYALAEALKATPVAAPVQHTSAGQPPAAPAPQNGDGERPLQDADGKYRCWGIDEKTGKECGRELKPFLDKGAGQWAAIYKKQYGKPLCPKCIAIEKAKRAAAK